MEKPLEDGAVREMVVGKISFGPNQEPEIFDRNRLTFRNYKKGVFAEGAKAFIPYAWAKQIMELAEVADNESLLYKESYPLINWIFQRYPDLKLEYEHLRTE